ncbi:MAG: S1 RNA-binding domain-containing protein [Actinomycetota bacterium]|nr:S1 RNA-binding domain-containing protein [Actinomycetota bacterium]
MTEFSDSPTEVTPEDVEVTAVDVSDPEPVAPGPVLEENAVEEVAGETAVGPEPEPEPVQVAVSESAPNHRRPPSGPPPPPPGHGPGSGLDAEVAVANVDAGKIVGGIATVVSADELELVLEDGRLAVIHRRNYAAAAVEDLNTVITMGDRLEGAVLARHDPRGRVVLSRAWAMEKRTWERLKGAAADHTVLPCLVTGSSKNGLVVDVDGVRGFVPLSHVSLEPSAELASLVGQHLDLKIIEIDADPRKRRLVLSRRSILLRDQRREAHDVLASLKPGDVRRGTVSSVSDYGAFVDLGGVNGLVHVSELAWTKVGHPREVVKPGDEVDVKVLEVKVKKRRVRLSIREASPDPLSTVTVGEVVTGRITHLVDFGAFVDVGGVEGLVHLSEMAEYRVYAPEELVTPGEEVMVKILSVDAKRRRIELSIRQAVQFG